MKWVLIVVILLNGNVHKVEVGMFFRLTCGLVADGMKDATIIVDGDKIQILSVKCEQK